VSNAKICVAVTTEKAVIMFGNKWSHSIIISVTNIHIITEALG